MDQEQKIKNLEQDITRLRNELADLSANFYKNNFSSSQQFNKSCVFADRLRVPVFDSAPTVAEVGDIFALSNGELYICTDASPVTWALVGTQS